MREICAKELEDSDWTVESYEQVPNLIKRHAWACQLQIALFDVELGPLVDQLSAAQSKYQSAPEGIRSFLLLPVRVEEKAVSLISILSRGYQYLGAIKVLKKREAFVTDRKRGNAASNRKPKKSDYQNLVTAMVKVAYQLEPPKNANVSKVELSQKYTRRIMEIWDAWPFFPLDCDHLFQYVDDAVSDLDLPVPKNKVLFKHRSLRTISRFENDSNRVYITAEESHFRACEERQKGMIEALVQVVEAKFGELSAADKEVIERSSPLQLGVWLRCVHDAETMKDLLSLRDS